MHLILHLVRALCVLVSLVLLLIVFVSPAYAGQDVNVITDPVHPEDEPAEEGTDEMPAEESEEGFEDEPGN